MMPSVELSVVVCTYNRAALLKSCLDSLCGQSLAQEFYEVIIVDNNSDDATRDVAVSYQGRIRNLQVVTELRQGLSHARNRGWQVAAGRFVAYLDDDAKATPDWCLNILKAFSTITPDPVAVGGPVYPWYLEEPPAWYSDCLETRSCGDIPRFLPPEIARYGFSGSNMAFAREVLARHHGFSTAFGMIGNRIGSGEETELFFRLSLMASPLWYDPGIVVCHLARPADMTLAKSFARGYRAGTAVAYIEKRKVWSRLYLFNLRKLVFQLFEFPLVATGRLSWRARMHLWFKRVASTLGYLVGIREDGEQG